MKVWVSLHHTFSSAVVIAINANIGVLVSRIDIIAQSKRWDTNTLHLTCISRNLKKYPIQLIFCVVLVLIKLLWYPHFVETVTVDFIKHYVSQIMGIVMLIWISQVATTQSEHIVEYRARLVDCSQIAPNGPY